MINNIFLTGKQAQLCVYDFDHDNDYIDRPYYNNHK